MYLCGMIRPRVYVETTIPSAYFEVRTAPTVVARREWTRKWWSIATARYELFTSPAVIAELVAGRSERGAERAALVQHLPLLSIGRPVLEIVQAYIRHKLMPANPASTRSISRWHRTYKCDFLVTWNCQHLANANKFGHIRRINTLLGLYVPSLVTPLELLGVSDEEPGAD
jgi:hypothetical protein